jgi:hypothetical protein
MDRTMSWRSRRLVIPGSNVPPKQLPACCSHDASPSSLSKPGLFLILVLLTTGKPAFSLVSAG